MYRILIHVVCLLLFAVAVQAEEGEEGFLLQFLEGTYQVIGMEPDGEVLYAGRITLKKDGHALEVTRNIQQKTAHGKGVLETVTADEIMVLKIRFEQDGKDLEGTYLIHSDLDNYARLTGHVYLQDGSTTKPGLEAFFIEK